MLCTRFLRSSLLVHAHLAVHKQKQIWVSPVARFPIHESACISFQEAIHGGKIFWRMSVVVHRVNLIHFEYDYLFSKLTCGKSGYI